MAIKVSNRCWTSLLVTGMALAIISGSMERVAAECPDKWICYPVADGMTAPTLDGNLNDWSSVQGITTSLQMPVNGALYEAGDATMKCMYDSENIYFALEFPGAYSFNASSDEMCAAIGTMTKVGVMATFYNMGGCPDAMGGCGEEGIIPDTCVDYVVDIGAHWELSTTEAGIEYALNLTATSGDDPIANKDDEFAVTPYCRFDDNDSTASNEWSGAWSHTNPTDGMDGTYIFELSRLLTTGSSATDAQYVAGQSYEFGVAFWDPFETENGWTDPGHYVTGCGNKWMELELATVESLASTENGDSQGGGSGAPVSTGALMFRMLSVLAAVMMASFL